MSLADDDHDTFDLVLGQTHHLLGVDGDRHAQALLTGVRLRLQHDGGFFYPIPGDNYDQASYEAVLLADPRKVPEFTGDITARVWSKLEAVLRGRGRHDVFGVIVEAEVPPLPEIGADWRDRAEQSAAEAQLDNQARRERARGGHPERDGLTLTNEQECGVYDALTELQRLCPRHKTFAIAPLPGVRLRDANVRTPDFVVLGNGRAVVVEVDDRSHYGTTRKADDADRDRHWTRCGVDTIRISGQHTEEPEALLELLREELARLLWRRA